MKKRFAASFITFIIYVYNFLYYEYNLNCLEKMSIQLNKKFFFVVFFIAVDINIKGMRTSNFLLYYVGANSFNLTNALLVVRYYW